MAVDDDTQIPFSNPARVGPSFTVTVPLSHPSCICVYNVSVAGEGAFASTPSLVFIFSLNTSEPTSIIPPS